MAGNGAGAAGHAAPTRRSGPAPAMARACLRATRGDHAAARAWLERSASAWRALGAGPELTTVLEALRILNRLQGGASADAATGSARTTDAEAASAGSHNGETAAWLAYAGGDYAAARQRFEAELAGARVGGRLVQTAALLTNLGTSRWPRAITPPRSARTAKRSR